MEYQVPQFIEVEDKIFGPFTLKQFIYLAGGAGLIAVFLLYLPLFIGILLSLPVAALAGALAFYKVNNKSFVEVLEAGLKFYTGDRLFIWKKERKAAAAPAPAPTAAQEAPRQKLGLSSEKLRDLAWSLDIKDGQPPQNP